MRSMIAFSLDKIANSMIIPNDWLIQIVLRLGRNRVFIDGIFQVEALVCLGRASGHRDASRQTDDGVKPAWSTPD